ncbi:MAG TPA: hypothetical protein VKW76_09725 [Candidatus Binatia bacterium]|nr:hypothetical protein [Candidatus Binatia bacterium]
MNGLITNVAQFWSQLFVDGAAFLQDQQGKLDANTFTTDDFIKSSAKLVLKETASWYRLMGLFPMGGDSTVVLQLPAGAAGPVSDVRIVRPTIGLGRLTSSALAAITGGGKGQLAATLTGFDLLTVQVSGVAGTAKGDLLAGLVYVVLADGSTCPLATVFLVVT